MKIEAQYRFLSMLPLVRFGTLLHNRCSLLIGSISFMQTQEDKEASLQQLKAAMLEAEQKRVTEELASLRAELEAAVNERLHAQEEELLCKHREAVELLEASAQVGVRASPRARSR